MRPAMKYIDEYRDGRLARGFAARIADEADAAASYRRMEFCGGHTHAIPLAQRPEVTLCTYGDLMRVPGSDGASLLKARAAGADIRMVYSTLDALRIAEADPAREVVFFAIGFETT